LYASNVGDYILRQKNEKYGQRRSPRTGMRYAMPASQLDTRNKNSRSDFPDSHEPQGDSRLCPQTQVPWEVLQKQTTGIRSSWCRYFVRFNNQRRVGKRKGCRSVSRQKTRDYSSVFFRARRGEGFSPRLFGWLPFVPCSLPLPLYDWSHETARKQNSYSHFRIKSRHYNPTCYRGTLLPWSTILELTRSSGYY